MIFSSIITTAIPLMLSSFGALVSDCARRLAIFMEGVINMGAFLCFAFVPKIGVLPGTIASVMLCIALVGFFLLITELTGADPFLIALSLNITSNAAVSLLSQLIFSTRGVLVSTAFVFDAAASRFYSTIFAIALLAVSIAALMLTRWGLFIRLCGHDDTVLENSGISACTFVRASWLTAAAFGSLAGCILTLRLSSFVPGVSSGCGWLSVAVVYMARSISSPVTKNMNGTSWVTCLAAFVMCLAISAMTLLAVNMQNVWPNAVPSLLLAAPHISCLVLLALIGQKR